MGLDSVYRNLGEVISRSGWAPASARDRQIEDGSIYDEYFSEPNLTKDCKKRDGSVADTVRLMKIIVKTKSQQVDRLARQVLAITNADGSLNVYKTVENIFNFIFRYIKYNVEEGEQLQSPRHTWWRAQKLARDHSNPENSADCDCMSIFAGSCMYRLGIPFAFKVAGYHENVYQHVYCVAYDGPNEIICDPVTNQFNYEQPPVCWEYFPMETKPMLNGTPIYVLDGLGVPSRELPVGISYRETPSGSLEVVGDLGKKSDKKAKKAAKKAEKAEKKAEKKTARAEKKAERQQNKAEKKAEKQIQKAERKAAKQEKKAEKAAAKGDTKKAEKLQKKADAMREAAQVKAENIKAKAEEKAENRQKRIDEKLAKKTAKQEVKKLKAEGASKEEITAAKQQLKVVRKEIREARKEDGRGVFRKVARGTKSAAMSPVRASFLMLMRLNFRGMATRFSENQEAYNKFVEKWKKIFGGKESKFKVAITRGKAQKPLFGSKKTNHDVAVAARELESNAETQQAVNGIFAGLGLEPTTTTAAVAMSTASSAVSAAMAILKACGVDVPEDVEDAINKGFDCAELVASQMVSEDPDNMEDNEPAEPTKAQKALEKVKNVSKNVEETANVVKQLTNPDEDSAESEPSDLTPTKIVTPGAKTEKEDGLSNGAKVGIGLVVLALLGIGIYSLSNNKNKNTNENKDNGLSGYKSVSLL